MTGTSELSFVGDQTGTTIVSNGNTKVNGISYQNPTVDGNSLITNDSTASPADTTLNFAGYTVNEGTIISDGSTGSSLTINVTQDGTAPGYFLNYGDIEADAGNTVTIAVAGTSELFNADLIYANGGTVMINGGTGIAGGYAPMLGGVALIGDGGTLELNAGFPAGTERQQPAFAFYDGDQRRHAEPRPARPVRRPHPRLPAGRHDRPRQRAEHRHDRRHRRRTGAAGKPRRRARHAGAVSPAPTTSARSRSRRCRPAPSRRTASP